jgi:hypothetical protein
MDIKRTYGVTVDLYLKTVLFDRPPTVRVGLNDQVKDLCLDQDTVVSFVAEANHGDILRLTVEHYGKTIADCKPNDNLDTAVVIDRININGIESQRFVWQGLYVPEYEKAYVEDQHKNGTELAPVLKHSSYLGWNGVWTLEFTAPVFTWIHKIENLGWIYD